LLNRNLKIVILMLGKVHCDRSRFFIKTG